MGGMKTILGLLILLPLLQGCFQSNHSTELTTEEVRTSEKQVAPVLVKFGEHGLVFKTVSELDHEGIARPSYEVILPVTETYEECVELKRELQEYAFHYEQGLISTELSKEETRDILAKQQAFLKALEIIKEELDDML